MTFVNGPRRLSLRDPTRDRRRERRASIDLTFSVHLGKGQNVLAQAVDLSSQGLRFHHLGPGVARGEALLIQFSLGPETFSFCGLPLRVKMVESFVQEVALSFVGIDPKTQTRLQASLPS